MQAQAADERRCNNKVEYAISDSGATSHFIIEGAPVVNLQVAKQPITVRLPDGSTLQSTHTCNLDIPWLPKEATEAHIIPGLAHSSLISTRKLCNAGCKVVFEDECRVYYKGELVLRGPRDPTTDLWRLPINPMSPPNGDMQSFQMDLHTSTESTQVAANVYTIPYRQNQVKFMHQSFLSPTIATLLKAINNNQLEGFPFMKADMIRKHLPASPATSKGHMKRPRAGIRSTRNEKHHRRNIAETKLERITAIHPNAVRDQSPHHP